MLPFLKPKPVGGVIISQRAPDGSNQVEGMEGDDSAGLNACAADLIRAINTKDEAAVASALKSVFEILGSQPDESNEDSSEEQQ